MTSPAEGGTANFRAKSGAEAVLLSLAEAQPERVGARCQHFGQCGGCQLQDTPPEAQVAAKQQTVVAVLQRAGVNRIPEVQAHVAKPWFYRNRARFRVHGDAIGYSRRASNEFLPIQECPILSQVLWRCASALQQIVNSGVAHWPAGTDSIELLANDDSTAVQLSVLLEGTVQMVDRGAPSALRALAEALQGQVPELLGAGLQAHAAAGPGAPRRVRDAARVEIARWGSSALEYVVSDAVYRVTRGAFFQVNRYLTGTMQRLVVDGRGGSLVWDLYAGAGLFSVPLARQFTRVLAVEVGEPAASDLQAALHLCGPQHEAVRTTVAQFLQRGAGVTRPDLIVLDPPRAGLGTELTRLLARADAETIVYVSCDADTFARDTRALVDSGYTLTELQLLDLFPQTFHTETVAVFRR